MNRSEELRYYSREVSHRVCVRKTAYEMMLKWNPYSVEDLLGAHRFMMQDLIKENGKFRSGEVGVYAGEAVVHVAPPAKFVSGQIKDLIGWYKESDMHPLIKSAIFHYEFEFIHPFAEGNGRMGRLWHTILLKKWKELFYWLPIETLIKTRQDEYYNALGKADKAGDSSEFVEMMLLVIHDTLQDYGNSDQDSDKDIEPQVRRLLEVLGSRDMSAAEIMKMLNLSHRPTFRKNYLNPALELGLIERTIPDKLNSRNQRYRKIVKVNSD